MKRLAIFLTAVLWPLLVLAASTSVNVPITVTGTSVPASIAIGSEGCSGTACSVPNMDDTFASNVASGLPPSSTYIGTLSTTLSAGPPPFGGSYTLVAHVGGDNCATGTINNAPFKVSSDQLQYNSGGTAGTTYNVCVNATVNGNSTTQEFTVTVHNVQNASTVSGCTGSGTSASPWTYACIQNAVTAAATGDTVFLPAGNFVLNTATDAAGVAINKPINVMGAGSANAFDVYGHINNGSGTTPCPTSLSTVTCIYPRGTSFQYPSNPPSGTTPSKGTIKVGLDLGGSSCNNNTFAHLAFDSSLVSPGGDDEALLNFERCPGPITVSDFRFYAFDGKSPTFTGSAAGTVLTVLSSPTGIISVGPELYVNGTDTLTHIVSYGSGTGGTGTYNLSGAVSSGSTSMRVDGNNETQFYSQVSSNTLIKNSMFGIPIVLGSYSGTEALETVGTTNETLNNVLIWQGFYAPTNNQNNIMTGSVTQTDVNTQLAAGVDYTGPTGCHMNPGNSGASGCAYGPGVDGTPHVTFSNNYFTTGSLMPNSVGGAVNDATTNGNVSDFNITGNWVVGTSASIAACTWIDSANEGFCNNSVGPALNATGDPTTCALSHDDSFGFNITNNSIVGSSVAKVDGQGFGTTTCFTTGGSTTVNIDVFGLNVQNNYFSSPSNQYTTNARTISPTQANNFCTSAAGTVTGCATSGFTNTPTGAFTLGNLYFDNIRSASAVPFTATSFTAQYGAVKWLASTNSTTPTSTDQAGAHCNGSNCAWAFVPPASLAPVAHGNTVYMWVMDSANNIGAATPVAIP